MSRPKDKVLPPTRYRQLSKLVDSIDRGTRFCPGCHDRYEAFTERLLTVLAPEAARHVKRELGRKR